MLTVNSSRFPAAAIFAGALFVVVGASRVAPAAPVFQTLHTFQSAADGYYPVGQLQMDAAGNLYGATLWGGSGPCGRQNCGTIFRLTPPARTGGAWTKTILTDFPDPLAQGRFPGGVILNGSGQLIGLTTGIAPTLFRLTPTVKGPWREKVLYAFPRGDNAVFPTGGPLRGADGSLFASTLSGNLGHQVFQFIPPPTANQPWTASKLYDASSAAGQPIGGLVQDSAGALYGATQGDQSGRTGCPSSGACGTVFMLTPPVTQSGNWTYNVLRRFGDKMGASLLAIDTTGNLYGVSGGGSAGYGYLYQLTRPASLGGKWTVKVLHTFKGGTEGAYPANITIGPDNTIYGVTSRGGSTACTNGGCGTVFKLTPPAAAGKNWKETTLYRFTKSSGFYPYAQLLLKDGVLYGSTVGNQSTKDFHNGASIFSLQL